MPSIEARFEEISSKSDGGRLLRAQWEYDKRLLTSALSTVSSLFPHYSQHDASHSDTILDRIASILGESGINQLSASDLWLLLESAYLHDAGMVALDAEKRGDLASAEFREFISQCLNGSDREFAELAKSVTEQGGISSPFAIYDAYQKLTFVYAEFVRRRHADRSGIAVLKPTERLAVDSPRVWLMPNRLWRTISKIVIAHGKSLEYVRELPHRELGLTTDYCHPRFVACMLRLGDLLDLDSGRFCPTINAQVARLPSLSEDHRRKHEGISHFLVSPERIEVSAHYDEIGAYLEAEKWLGWLRDELQSQTLDWSEIAPSASFGRLPTVGIIRATLTNQIVLTENGRPRLELDRIKVLQLIRGANIYEHHTDVVREVLQNAVDATVLRYSFDSQSSAKKPPANLKELRESLEKYPISVSVEKFADDEINGDNEWLLVVKDNGIGMSREDVERMLCVGSSKKSKGKSLLLKWLPEWAKPSGAFGIGFNSLFQYCDRVEVETRHPRSNELLSISFTKKGSLDEPTVIVTSKFFDSASIPSAPGTTVNAYFKLRRLPSSVQWPQQSEAKTALKNFDNLLDDELHYVPAVIRDFSRTFALNSPCRLNVQGVKAERMSENSIREFFCPIRGVALSLERVGLKDYPVFSHYRGSEVSKNSPRTGIISISIDIYSGPATDFLTLSRTQWTTGGRESVETHIERMLPEAAKYWQTTEKGDSETLRHLDLYFAITENRFTDREEWKKIIFLSSYTLGDIATAKQITLRIPPDRAEKIVVSKQDDGGMTIAGDPDSIFGRWFLTLIFAHFNSVRVIALGPDEASYLFFNAEQAVFDFSADILLKSFDNSAKPIIGRRSAVHCPERFKFLALKQYSGYRGFTDRYFPQYMANPFVSNQDKFEFIGLESYVRKVSKSNGNSVTDICSHLRALGKELLNAQDWTNRPSISLDQFNSEIEGIEKKAL